MSEQVTPPKKNIAVVVTATNKYRRFVNPLYDSVKKNFLPHHNVQFFLFTDDNSGLKYDHWYHCPHEAWPGVALTKHKRIADKKHVFLPFDFVFIMDADSLVINPVGDEVLNDITAVIHPGYMGGKGTPCKNPKSHAFLKPKQMKVPYLGSAIMGGKAKLFVGVCERLANLIQDDLDRNVIADWHDESHWLKFINSNYESSKFKIEILKWNYLYSFAMSKGYTREEVKIAIVEKSTREFHQ